MKYIKRMAILIIVLSLIGIPLTVSATDTGLATEVLSSEEISKFSEKSEFIKITSPSPMAASCFDVRDDHMVVIGANAGDTAVITVYDDCGNFQYGFTKEELGSFRVMWSGNDIAYYSIRSALLYKINRDGRITNISRVANTMENSIYDRDVLQSTTRTVDNTTYHMTNELAIADRLPGTFKKIIKADTAGTTVIYDASGSQRINIIVGLVFFGLLSVFIASAVIVGMKKQFNQNNPQ